MIFFGWGAKVVPLGLYGAVCGACGHDGVLRYFFRYQYFGILWLGGAWNRQLIVECPFCADAFAPALNPADAQSLAGHVPWNYRYGWMLWAGIFAAGAFSAFLSALVSAVV